MTLRPTDVLAVLLVWAANAVADPAAVEQCTADGHDVLANVRARGTLRVAQTHDYRPFSFRDVRQSPSGIDAELARNLADGLGVSVEWIDTTWSTLVSDLQSDRFDIAMSGVSITQERAAAGCFSAAYFSTGKTALTRCAVHRTFDTLAQLDAPQVTVIVNRGGTNERFARDHLTHARIVVHEDNRMVFAALAAGEADVMITDSVEARLEASSNPALCVADPPPLFEVVTKAFLIPKDPAWQRRVNAWLERLEQSGALAVITDRYLNAPQTATAAQPG